MNSWILSIVGIVCVNVIVDILLPEGEMQKYIKNFFALIIVLVIVSPLPKYINQDYSLTNIFKATSINLDSNLLAKINYEKASSIKEIIINKFIENDINISNVDINIDAYNEEFKILSIYVNASEIFHNKTSEVINDIKIDIINLIDESINIDKEIIYFNE